MPPKSKKTPAAPAPAKLSKKASAKSAEVLPKNLGKRVKRPAATTPEEEKVPEAKANKRAKTCDKSLDLALLLDCTSSMASWIERAKDTLKTIIDAVVGANEGLKVRVSFVGYRDFCDDVRFEVLDFTEDVQKVRDFISKVTANGGGDLPEDLSGGMRKCLDLKWEKTSEK
jgi:hypothetical protein